MAKQIEPGDILYINNGFYRGYPAKILSDNGWGYLVKIALPDRVIERHKPRSSLSRTLRNKEDMMEYLTTKLAGEGDIEGEAEGEEEC